MILKKSFLLLAFTSTFVFSLGIAADHTIASSISAAQAQQVLVDGNTRFRNGQTKADNSAARRQELASGQSPKAIVLSCADSRVPPETVFDEGLGDVFVVRNAGEQLDNNVIASIEYAIAHLGTKLIVVMGHSSCGAVKAALTTPAGQSAGSPDLDKLVSSIQHNIKEKPSTSIDDATMKAAIDENAQAVAQQLPSRSAIIRDAQAHSGLKIVSANYDLATGQVRFDQ